MGGSSTVFESSQLQFSSEGRTFSFHFRGESLPPRETVQCPSDAALDYAYIGVKSRPLRTDLFLGRILVEEGIAEELMDGFYGRTDFAGRTRFSFFSGRTAGSGNDLLGGRFRYKFSPGNAAAVSCLAETAGGQTIREEAALDLRLRPANKITLTGRSLIDLRTGNWTEHSYFASIGPFRKTTVMLGATLFDTGPGLSGSAAPQHTETIGFNLQHAVSRRLAAGFEVKRTADPFAGTVYFEGVQASVSLQHSWSLGASIFRQTGKDLSLLGMAASISKTAGALRTALTLQRTMNVNHQDAGTDGYSASLGLAYDLNPSYSLIADMQQTKERSSNRKNLSSFLRLEYRFGS